MVTVTLDSVKKYVQFQINGELTLVDSIEKESYGPTIYSNLNDALDFVSAAIENQTDPCEYYVYQDHEDERIFLKGEFIIEEYDISFIGTHSFDEYE